ncbi:MAG: VWA domain-containing protein, partial [Acidobacteria bacterium]|nr:VWA domain-containing protein [Acidobacteriota bacterium]
MLLAVAGAHQPAAAQPPPTYRSSVDVVEVDVVVQNKRGEFVSDLELEDFELFEEGKLQRVQHLNLYLLEDQRKPAARAGNAVDMTATFSAPRVFIVVFDEGHMSPAGFKRAQEAASTLFDDHLGGSDLGGVVINGVMTNDRLTSDRSELLKAVRDARPSLVKTSRQMEERQWPRLSEVEAVRIVLNGDSIVLEDVSRRACSEDADQCRGLDGAVEEYVQSKATQIAEEARVQSAQTLQLLTQLMNGLGTVAGRKSVLLLSEGFMADESWPLVQEAQELAARANARIYTLDPRGFDRGGSAPGTQ